ncbi:MAG: hypothetical protein DRO93_03505 [Candidatus Thorarchaeota archaeon]|nr:MAG: hypothetical protein DRO93_03505 [Candidatus Thorarchaeota archaeon]
MVRAMKSYEQEWISPILEVYKKRKITDTYTVILGLNPMGQALCRRLYERNRYETILVFNSPSFSTWNRYPSDVKPPVVPVHAMADDETMLIFGDVFVKDYEWVTDMLFYLSEHVPMRFVIALSLYDGPTCGQVLTQKGERLLKRMEIPRGHPEFYDGLVAPLISIGNVIDIDPVVLYLESTPDEIVLQVDDVTVTQADIDGAMILLEKGLRI